MKIVMVEWNDAKSDGGWLYPDEIKLRVAKCVSIGVKTQDGDIIITQSLNDAGRQSDRLIIPSGCIRRIRRLKVC